MLWLNLSPPSEYSRLAAAKALVVLKAEGVDIAQEVLDSFEPIPDTPADTALRLLRDQANADLKDVCVQIGMHIPPHRKKGTSAAVIKYSAPEGGTDLVLFWGGLISSIAHPPKHLRKCPQCGTVFAAKTRAAVYCSDVCRATFNKNN